MHGRRGGHFLHDRSYHRYGAPGDRLRDDLPEGSHRLPEVTLRNPPWQATAELSGNLPGPDGLTVVFEVTSEVAIVRRMSLPPEQQGFFAVRSDGTGLRRLGPASRVAAFRLVPVAVSPVGGPAVFPRIPYSPDGRTIAFPD